jgi:hypothetical protein
MAIGPMAPESGLRTVSLPPGPALLYVTEGDNPTITILDLADPGLMRHRDRAICRALLAYVIEGMALAD